MPIDRVDDIQHYAEHMISIVKRHDPEDQSYPKPRTAYRGITISTDGSSCP